MDDADLAAYAAAGARLLGIAVAPDWQASVCANLRVALHLGAVVGEQALPDEAEPAPVFVA